MTSLIFNEILSYLKAMYQLRKRYQNKFGNLKLIIPNRKRIKMMQAVTDYTLQSLALILFVFSENTT